MEGSQFIILDKSNIKDLAEVLAPMIKEALNQKDADPLMTPKELAKQVSILSEWRIKEQIRKGNYGKRIGAKGRLAARLSEVKKFNRL